MLRYLSMDIICSEKREKRVFLQVPESIVFCSLGISLYLAFFCVLSFVSFVLRHLCSGTCRRSQKREAGSEKRNCELRGTDNVQGQISKHIFKAKWRLLCLSSIKYFSQRVFGEYHWIFPSFSWGIFSRVIRLNQSRVSETIWWIISTTVCIYVQHCSFRHHLTSVSLMKIILQLLLRHYFQTMILKNSLVCSGCEILRRKYNVIVMYVCTA